MSVYTLRFYLNEVTSKKYIPFRFQSQPFLLLINCYHVLDTGICKSLSVVISTYTTLYHGRLRQKSNKKSPRI